MVLLEVPSFLDVEVLLVQVGHACLVVGVLLVVGLSYQGVHVEDLSYLEVPLAPLVPLEV